MADLDLFAPLVPREKWHPNFARITDYPLDAERDVLRAWARDFRDRDGKFAYEFQTSFNSGFWELYLFALFREAGCVLDQQHARPDFVAVDGPLGQFTAEAVIASNPEVGAPEWTCDPSRPPLPRETILDLASLRLAQALPAKSEKWKSGYSKLAHCSARPFVVCIGPFEQPWASLQGTEAIDRVLFTGPRPVVSAMSGEPIVMGYTAQMQFFELGIAVHRFSASGTVTAVPAGLLMARVAYDVRSASGVAPRHDPLEEYVPHQRAQPPNGVPFGGPSASVTTDQGTLELCRGWTIYVRTRRDR